MKKAVAVQGCTLQISGVTPGVATITTSPSTKGKAGGIGVYRGTVSVSLSVCSNGTFIQSGPASGDFILTATKNKADGQLVLREDDETGSISVPMQNSVSPFNSSSFPVTVKITNAGQSKAKGE